MYSVVGNTIADAKLPSLCNFLCLVLAKFVAQHEGQLCQGGLDDYFLSGATTCSDGAESCPDTTKVDKS